MIFTSFVSYGQFSKIKLDNDYGMSMSFLSSKFNISNWSMDIVLNNPYKIGFGIEMYGDKVIYDNDFISTMDLGSYKTKEEKLSALNTNQRSAIGIYYVSPSIKNFDLIIGGGSIDYSLEQTYQTGDYVNGYTKSNGTNVSGYYRNVRMVTSMVQVDKTYYALLGVSKSFKITNGVYLQIRGITRYLPKYGNEELGRIVKPQLQLGVKFKI